MAAPSAAPSPATMTAPSAAPSPAATAPPTAVWRHVATEVVVAFEPEDYERPDLVNAVGDAIVEASPAAVSYASVAFVATRRRRRLGETRTARAVLLAQGGDAASGLVTAQLSAAAAGGALEAALVDAVASYESLAGVAADDAVDADFLRRACRRTPLEEVCEELLADPGADPVARATVTGFERGNLVLFLVIVQFVQVLLLAATVFGFFLLFGALTMGVGLQEAWTGLERDAIHTLPYLAQVSVPLGKVSLFLGSFSLLYLTVSTVTDEAYREQFFGLVTRELERAVGVRAVYLTLREQRRQGSA